MWLYVFLACLWFVWFSNASCDIYCQIQTCPLLDHFHFGMALVASLGLPSMTETMSSILFWHLWQWWKRVPSVQLLCSFLSLAYCMAISEWKATRLVSGSPIQGLFSYCLTFHPRLVLYSSLFVAGEVMPMRIPSWRHMASNGVILHVLCIFCSALVWIPGWALKFWHNICRNGRSLVAGELKSHKEEPIMELLEVVANPWAVTFSRSVAQTCRSPIIVDATSLNFIPPY
jgi:hypothetical protein